MFFFAKLFFYVGILAGGAYLAVDHIPSLRANIIEYANPRIKEARLLTELQTHIDTAASVTISSPATRQAAAAKARAIVAQIAEINDDNSGMIPVVVEKIVNVAQSVTPMLPAVVTKFLPDALTATPAPASTTAPIASPCPVR